MASTTIEVKYPDERGYIAALSLIGRVWAGEIPEVMPMDAVALVITFAPHKVVGWTPGRIEQ